MSKAVVTKRGKPFRSVLAPYEREVQDFHAQGMSVRAIAAEMLARHGVQISHNAVASFLRTHRRAKNFLNGLTETQKGELLKVLKALWTHDSTAIEGNTLTLDDTMVVLEYVFRRERTAGAASRESAGLVCGLSADRDIL